MYRDGTIPYQRFRAWQIAGRTVGIVGLRRRRAGHRVAARRARHARHLLRPVRAGRDPLARGPARRSRRRLDARGGDARDREPHRARAVPAHEGRRDLHQLGARAAARHRCARRRRCKAGEIAGAGLDHFVGENLPPDHPLCSMDNVVLTPHIGGATCDTEANHSRLIANGLRTLLEGGRPDEPGEPGGAAVSDVTMTAQEVKEQVLWAAQEMLRSGLVEGTAGNLAGRLPDGNAVLTPSSLDYLEMAPRRPRRVRPRRQRARGRALPHDREGAAPRRAAAARRHQRDDALPREVRHDVRADPSGHPRGHRGVRRLHRRRRRVRGLPDDRHRRARRGGRQARRATAARC